MELKFIGYGGAFDHPLVNSSMVLRLEDNLILVDCGFNVYGRLRELDLVEKLTHVFITHLHDDHCGSLATLIFHRYFVDGKRLTLLHQDDKFLTDLKEFLRFGIVEPERYVRFAPISSIDNLVPIDTTDQHMKGVRSYALLLRNTGQKDIVISGDLYEFGFLVNQLDRLGIKEPLIFADTAYDDYGGAHAWYKTIEKYLDRFEIISYHNDPAKKPADCKLPFVTEREKFIWG